MLALIIHHYFVLMNQRVKLDKICVVAFDAQCFVMEFIVAVLGYTVLDSGLTLYVFLSGGRSLQVWATC